MNNIDESKIKSGYGNIILCGRSINSHELLRQIIRGDVNVVVNQDIHDYVKLGYSFDDSLRLYNQSLEFINEVNLQPSLDAQISNIKSQLKYCKNPLQKLNLEREINKLIRERNRK